MLSSYEKFSTAIIENDIKKAENIFAYSDERCNLIAYCIQFTSQKDIVQIFKLFESTGLKNQAISICENCTKSNCTHKANILQQRTVYRYSSKTIQKEHNNE